MIVQRLLFTPQVIVQVPGTKVADAHLLGEIFFGDEEFLIYDIQGLPWAFDVQFGVVFKVPFTWDQFTRNYDGTHPTIISSRKFTSVIRSLCLLDSDKLLKDWNARGIDIKGIKATILYGGGVSFEKDGEHVHLIDVVHHVERKQMDNIDYDVIECQAHDWDNLSMSEKFSAMIQNSYPEKAFYEAHNIVQEWDFPVEFYSGKLLEGDYGSGGVSARRSLSEKYAQREKSREDISR